MAIEGPLRELGIHDVFQLLDVSRKTGALRVTSALRDNEGTIVFERGRVISASLRSSPAPLGTMLLRAERVTEQDLARARQLQTAGDTRRLGEILLAIGALSARELERHVRLQIEAVVFEIMSWREGFFSFETREINHATLEATVSIGSESLLMEGVRRMDEWSRIAERVPHLGMVPALAEPEERSPALPPLDLQPSEWELLATIDGEQDLRSIAAHLGRSEFDAAGVVYRLAENGVITLQDPGAARNGRAPAVDVSAELATAWKAVNEKRSVDALSAAQLVVAAEPDNAEARLVAARALRQLKRFGDAAEELRRAADVNPHLPAVHLEAGHAAVCRGDFSSAVESWQRFLEAAPDTPEIVPVREAMASASYLREFVEAYVDA